LRSSPTAQANILVQAFMVEGMENSIAVPQPSINLLEFCKEL
jgi:hypothetical protein